MRLGLIGYGTIARTLAGHLAAVSGIEAVTVLVRPGREADVPASFGDGAIPVAAVTSVDALLAERPDFVVECAGHSAVDAFVPPLLRAGLDVVVVSIGALADEALSRRLRDAAVGGRSRMILPAGAVGGIDILSALGAGGEIQVRYTGTKPPKAWAGTPAEAVVDLAALDRPAVIFEGTAREAATAYPKNANVAATLALAGAGFEATRVVLVADPSAPGNVHEFEAVSPVARVTMRIENAPSGNAKTSLATIMSVLREIRNRQGPVVI
ncbi:aspartate dehydrogenase [Aquibium sp. ELW1220]|uniref:aspartate dehydrogenase n=1 Tax=Aquibium sp. ELW1220 TaxID=2976766 RepID=UPI0025B022C0|nr:aspartate dehydrogenase [Aquibium sp. ELW1220]MDN2582067.1 aspartate dehydrogenase [Aquibium sp. ELW1220]